MHCIGRGVPVDRADLVPTGFQCTRGGARRPALHRHRRQRGRARPGLDRAGHPGEARQAGVRPGIPRGPAGEYKERQAAQRNLFIFGFGAALVIFLLLQVSYGSWRLATLSFFTLPSALVGGLFAAFVAGRTISLGSLVGFLTVLGIAARNGILLISRFQHLERDEGEVLGLTRPPS